jgi:hypothetical protein
MLNLIALQVMALLVALHMAVRVEQLEALEVTVYLAVDIKHLLLVASTRITEIKESTKRMEGGANVP